MSKIDFLKEQIIEARTFVNCLMSELPEDLWYVIPEGTDSNFIWQVGHLLVSQNFHTLTAVTGVNEKVGRLVPPIPKYNRIFNGMGTLHRSIEKDLIPVAELREQTEIIHQICIENLETLMFWQSACSLSRLNILLRKLNMKHCRGALNMKCGIVQKWKLSKEI